MSREPVNVRLPVTVHDQAEAERCARGRVILIDDDTEILASLEALVRLMGLQAECFARADEFLSRLALGKPVYPGPTCVVSDVRMPGLDGLALLRRVREMNGHPLVLMSGNSGLQDAIEAFHLGTVDFLVKPFEAVDFLAVVNKALGISTAAQAMWQEKAALQLRIDSLTLRERSVAIQVAGGHLNREIAARLGITERMVKMHRRSAMEKLKADRITDLVRLLDQAGLTG